jgi:hypothetical protein
MPLVDAVVDDPDLDARAGARQLGGGKRAGADGCGVGACKEVIRRRCEDLRDAGEPRESRKLARRQDDRDAVRDEPVAPVDLGRRDPDAQRRLEASLLGVDATLGARRAVHRERGRGQEHHDLASLADRRRGLVRRRGADERRDADGEEEGESERARHVD